MVEVTEGEVLVWREGREEALWRKENAVGHQGFSVLRSSVTLEGDF